MVASSRESALTLFRVSDNQRDLLHEDYSHFLVDPGSSEYFHAHRILFQANIYGLENVAALDRVLKYLSSRKETFFSFDVLPMKIGGGTGAPCRLVARLEDFDKAGGAWFGFLIFFLLLAVFGIAAKAVYDLKFNPNKVFG